MFNQCSKIDKSVIKNCNINIFTIQIWWLMFYSHTQHTGRCHPHEAPHRLMSAEGWCSVWEVASDKLLGSGVHQLWGWLFPPPTPPSLSLLTRHSWVQSLQRIIRRRNRLQLASRSFCPSPPLLLPVHQLTLEIICIRNAWPSVVILPRYIVWDKGE